VTWVDAGSCLVTVCRGCCCGSAGKHPDTDHHAQIEQLRTRLGDRHRVRIVDCLDLCAQSNVVVIQPSAAGRRAGGRPTRLGWILHPDALDDAADWIWAGGPGLAATPDALTLHTIRRPRG